MHPVQFSIFYKCIKFSLKKDQLGSMTYCIIVDSNVKKYLFLYLSIDEVRSTNVASFESSMKMNNFGMVL